MTLSALVRRFHRIVASLFLLAVPPAGYASIWGDAISAWVYAPLPFLFGLMLTGTYLLVRPWILQLRSRRQGHESQGR